SQTFKKTISLPFMKEETRKPLLPKACVKKYSHITSFLCSDGELNRGIKKIEAISKDTQNQISEALLTDKITLKTTIISNLTNIM
ncbi:hypothetical protein, partial [Qipengyuania thermophila]|uniref:hypothetical protein n=1 Tax=Qipengyuania thermophila TaxID=2509361 RepID=UPI0013EA5EB2